MRLYIMWFVVFFGLASSVHGYEDTRGGKILTLMGFDVALASLVPEMKAVKENAPNMGEEIFDDWDDIVESVFKPDAILLATSEALNNTLSEAEFAELNAYFSDGLGYDITQMENAAHSVENMGKSDVYGPGILEEMAEVNPERLAQIHDLITALGTVETSTTSVMNIGFALNMGMISASDNPLGITEDQVLRELFAQHDQITQNMKIRILNDTAYTYQMASNAEFSQYVTFLKSDLSQKFYGIVREVNHEMMTGFSRKLGRELVKRANARKL